MHKSATMQSIPSSSSSSSSNPQTNNSNSAVKNIDDFVPDREPGADSFWQFLEEPNAAAVLAQGGGDGDNYGIAEEDSEDDEEDNEGGGPMVAKYQEDLDSEDEPAADVAEEVLSSRAELPKPKPQKDQKLPTSQTAARWELSLSLSLL